MILTAKCKSCLVQNLLTKLNVTWNSVEDDALQDNDRCVKWHMKGNKCNVMLCYVSRFIEYLSCPDPLHLCLVPHVYLSLVIPFVFVGSSPLSQRVMCLHPSLCSFLCLPCVHDHVVKSVFLMLCVALSSPPHSLGFGLFSCLPSFPWSYFS